MSTLKEPYRIEGKKTLGYEIAEQLNWQLPDVILYPTGGGTGLIGMWKAFDEMEALGWIDKSGPVCLLFRRAVARQSYAHLKQAEKFAPTFRMRTHSPPVCVFQKRLAIFLC